MLYHDRPAAVRELRRVTRRDGVCGVVTHGRGHMGSVRRLVDVTVVRHRGQAPVRVTDAGIVADVVASVADHYQHEVSRPWSEVVEEVRRSVEAVIEAEGAFEVVGAVGLLVCR